jgi:hypothetical protein
MESWVLVMFLSVGYGEQQMGGPVSIGGFKSQSACLSFVTDISEDFKNGEASPHPAFRHQPRRIVFQQCKKQN